MKKTVMQSQGGAQREAPRLGLLHFGRDKMGKLFEKAAREPEYAEKLEALSTALYGNANA